MCCWEGAVGGGGAGGAGGADELLANFAIAGYADAAVLRRDRKVGTCAAITNEGCP